MSDDDEGLSLADAVRVYGDPELWAAYESARSKLNSIPPKPPWIGGSRSDRKPWSGRYEEAVPAARAALHKAWQAALTDFKRRLRRGELVATGLRLPLEDEHSQRIVIAKHLWSVLVPDFRHSAAKGGGLEFVDVRVDPAAVADFSATMPREFSRDDTPRAAEDHVVPPRKGGRPSVMPALDAEMSRRAQQGELEPSVRREAVVLAKWAARKFPGIHTPKWKSIERQLGPKYRQIIEAKKRSDKPTDK